MVSDPLPLPDSEEIDALGMNAVHRSLYSFLYRRREHPPTMLEIRRFAADTLGEQNQIDRRVRKLRDWFQIDVVRDGDESRYQLAGWNARQVSPGADQISGRVRAEVLAPARCAMCGKTPLDHGVKLVVDHKVPQNWGGGNEVENLQPLCEECNGGKQDRFASFDGYGDKIRQAISYEEPHRRIGELLIAFDGEWVPSDLLGMVASAQQFQEDWQKRTRELRKLGWNIEIRKDASGIRVRTYYRAAEWHLLPEENIAGAIRRIEKREKRERQDRERSVDGSE